MNQFNFTGQQLIKSISDDGMGLTAADFHYGP
jgi:hypothetical protein